MLEPAAVKEMTAGAIEDAKPGLEPEPNAKNQQQQQPRRKQQTTAAKEKDFS